MSKIFVAGGTGLVGKTALELLLADPRISEVVAPTRRPLSPHPNLLNPSFDKDCLRGDADWWSVDGAICALGTTRAKSASAQAYREIDYDLALAVASQLKQGGARRFALVTSMGANERSWFPYTRTKGELERDVRDLAFQSLTIVPPGFIDGDRTELRSWEAELRTFLRMIGPILPASARASPSSIVARILVEAALTGSDGVHTVSAGQIDAIARS